MCFFHDVSSLEKTIKLSQFVTFRTEEKKTEKSSVNNLEIASKPRRIISNSIFSTEIYDSKYRILLRKKE